VINYNYGQDVVRKYIESDFQNQADQSKASAGHWKKFSQLLSNPVTTNDLMK
jgi:hypothetical protein